MSIDVWLIYDALMHEETATIGKKMSRRLTGSLLHAEPGSPLSP